VLAVTHWYASGTFWAVAGVGAIVLFGVLTVAVTWIVGTARRYLIYSIPTVTPILSSAADPARSDLQVTLRGEIITEPHVVSVRLDSRGRRDIRSTDFDQDKPLVLDVGARIVAVLARKSFPESLPAPVITSDGGTKVSLGPTLIRRRQTMQIDLLVDGPNPVLTCESPLVDVAVREQRPEVQSLPRWIVITMRVIILASLAAFVVVFFVPLPRNPAQTPSWWDYTTNLLLMIIFAAVAVLLYGRARRSR
jgi:hypothetical protein